jgi:PKD repeat protein
MSDETTPDWVDYYYWDGARGVYYGEWWTEPYEAWDPFCSYWRDVATGQSYGPYACPAETNDYPIASFTVACSGLNCRFDATGSTDSDGTIQEFHWSFSDGTDGSGATTEHTYAAGSTYAVQLVVADDGGLTGYASEQVTVSVGTAPIAAFTVNCTGALCNFDASGSSDDDGTIRTYSWSFGDGTGTSGSTPTATHTYGPAGTYSARLAVTDDSGNIAVADRDVAVATGNPIANFIVHCSGLHCAFDGNDSADPDGTIQTYAWSFGDGTETSGSTATATHTYTLAGIYAVRLAVTDDSGHTAVASTDLFVANTAPTAAFTANCAGLRCAFDASGSTDSDGTIRTYGWDFGDGAGASTGIATAAHTYGLAGSYTVTLTVTDNAGGSAHAVRVVVLITLTARAYKAMGGRKVDLSWTGQGGSFDVFRSGARVATVQVTTYTDAVAGRGTYTYQVCTAAGATCSNQITFEF